MSGQKIIEGAEAALAWTRGEGTARVTLSDGTRGEMTAAEVIERTAERAGPWAGIARRAREATGADRELDCAVHIARQDGGTGRYPDATAWTEVAIRERWNVPSYTASLDAMRGLIAEKLPGFWVTSGLCGLNGHASLGPDYNGPNGERLRREWPEELFDAGFDADLAPGDGLHRECLALLDVFARAMAAQGQPFLASS